MTTLWYRRPAEVWTEALPIGNGRLGGMVFGGVATERIALNDDTLWSGGPQDETNPGGPRTLKEVREFLAKGDYAAADDMSKRMMGPYTASYLALGDVTLDFDHIDTSTPFTDYCRSLDLATGTARTEYVMEGTRFMREVFSSNPDQAIVLRLTTDGLRRFGLVLRLTSPFSKFPEDTGGRYLQGKAPALVDPTYYRRGKIVLDANGDGMRFAICCRVSETDGYVADGPDDICLTNATHATIVLTTATSFSSFLDSPARNGIDESLVARTQIDLARRKPYDTLRQTHVADHAALFDRVSFSLRTPDNGRPTDELLAAGDDPGKKRLAELLFQYGRYLLIACSRPGDQPANLQGIWNAEMRAPWSGNFTTNINTQMNYWPAGPTNLLECQEPLLDLIDDLSYTGGKIAKTNYGMRGWCAHHNVDLWRHAAPAGDWGAPPADPVWAIWPMGGAWLSQHVWEHFAFGRDVGYLREKAWPILAGACRFVLDFLVEGPDGRLTTSPSTSPEHRFAGPGGKTHALSVGTTADLSMIHDLFTNTIEAARALGMVQNAAAEAADSDGEASRPYEECAASAAASDVALMVEIRNALARLAVPRVLPDGRVAEWSHDFPGEDEQHRHVSHLFALHPGRQWQHDERMKAAARRSLEVRGNASTGWSLAWKINLWARLGDGEQALECIDRLLTPVTEQGVSWQGGVYPNLFDAHPPFQIDGNFGYTAGVCEMLLQSHAGELHLLPALPKAWPDGDVTGLRARGGITVGLSWRAGDLVRATLCPDRETTARVRYADRTAEFHLLSGRDFAIDGTLL